MRIDKTRKIAGMPILKVRDLLRKVSNFAFSSPMLARYGKVAPARAAALAAELLENKLVGVESIKDGIPHYKLTAAGIRLCAASGARRISRAKAEQLLADFLERVRNVNRRPELAYRVDRVTIFGSYLTKSRDLGDLDLSVELSLRSTRLPIHAYNEQRMEATGRRPSNVIEQVLFARIEVLKILKNRSPYINITRPEEIERLRRKKVIYERRKKR